MQQTVPKHSRLTMMLLIRFGSLVEVALKAATLFFRAVDYRRISFNFNRGSVNACFCIMWEIIVDMKTTMPGTWNLHIAVETCTKVFCSKLFSTTVQLHVLCAWSALRWLASQLNFRGWPNTLALLGLKYGVYRVTKGADGAVVSGHSRRGTQTQGHSQKFVLGGIKLLNSRSDVILTPWKVYLGWFWGYKYRYTPVATPMHGLQFVKWAKNPKISLCLCLA